MVITIHSGISRGYLKIQWMLLTSTSVKGMFLHALCDGGCFERDSRINRSLSVGGPHHPEVFHPRFVNKPPTSTTHLMVRPVCSFAPTAKKSSKRNIIALPRVTDTVLKSTVDSCDVEKTASFQMETFFFTNVVPAKIPSIRDQQITE